MTNKPTRAVPGKPAKVARAAQDKPPHPEMADALQDKDHLYHDLAWVLAAAFHQAARGKGAERHGDGRPFREQRMFTIAEGMGTEAGLIFQANKKSQESMAMERDAAIHELAGAVVYLAGAMLCRQSEED